MVKTNLSLVVLALNRMNVKTALKRPLVNIWSCALQFHFRQCSIEWKDSKARANFHVEVEEKINQQIEEELTASYAYMSLKKSHEETEHAWKLIQYQNLRGGHLKLTKCIEPLPLGVWTPATAVDKAIELEKKVTQMLEALHDKATEHGDRHLLDYIETEFLTEQYSDLKKLADLRQKIQSVGPGLGIHILDGEITEQLNDEDCTVNIL